MLDDFSRGRQDATFADLARRARLIRHDLTRPVPAELLPTRVDTVYHLAAVVGVQRTQDNPGRSCAPTCWLRTTSSIGAT